LRLLLRYAVVRRTTALLYTGQGGDIYPDNTGKTLTTYMR
jgi:hypothetical protein